MNDTEILIELIEELKQQCNKHKNGTCQNRDCLVQGGYVRGKLRDYSIATCEKDKQIITLEKLLCSST